MRIDAVPSSAASGVGNVFFAVLALVFWDGSGGCSVAVKIHLASKIDGICYGVKTRRMCRGLHTLKYRDRPRSRLEILQVK